LAELLDDVLVHLLKHLLVSAALGVAVVLVESLETGVLVLKVVLVGAVLGVTLVTVSTVFLID